jgi:hypothetical protein
VLPQLSNPYPLHVLHSSTLTLKSAGRGGKGRLDEAGQLAAETLILGFSVISASS